MMSQDEIVIRKENSNLVKENIHLILQFWSTEITFETMEESEEITGASAAPVNDNQWLKLSGVEKTDIEKAKEYIKALSNPQVVEIVEIDENLKKKLDIDFINNLIEKHQVHLVQILNKNLVCQGSNENVEMTLNDLQCKSLGKKDESSADFKNWKSISTSSKLLIKDPVVKNKIDLISEINENDINFAIDMKNFVPESFSRLSNKVNNEKNQCPVREENLSNLTKKNDDFKKNDYIEQTIKDCDKRFIIIDGSNVAVEHGKHAGNGKLCFSCKGIQLAVEYFKKRGHKNIKALVPRYRRNPSNFQCPSINPEILDKLEQNGFLSYTPSRRIDNKLVIPYDDRFILKAAEGNNGIIISNDNYRDLQNERPEWKTLIDTNLLQFTFVGDIFMIADDPFGKKGPSIDELLSNKDRRGSSSKSGSNKQFTEISNNISKYHDYSQSKNISNKQISTLTSYDNTGIFSVEQDTVEEKEKLKIRDEEATAELFLKLIEIFPDSTDKIAEILQENPANTDIAFFTNLLIFS